MMSRLISTALPVKDDESNGARLSQDDKDNMEMKDGANGQSRVAVYEKRMKAMNYIGSLMTQNTVEISDQFYNQCLKLILRRFR